MSQKFGLGRGLADLKTEMGQPAEISVLASGERVVVRNLPIANIVANPDQPRKTFTDDQLQDLANSIAEKGVLQPILVRNSSKHPGNYEIIAGERRWRASQMAGLSEIPALVKNINDSNAMEVALIENVQRENLNAIEEAAAYKNLMDVLGYEMVDLVKLIGKSESYIRNILRLGGLPDAVKDMVGSGELSASHARTLAVAENAEALARTVVDNKLSVEDTAKLVKSGERSSKSRAFQVNSIPAEQLREYEGRLESALSVPARLKIKKGAAGEVILKFNNKFQMEQLIELLLRQ